MSKDSCADVVRVESEKITLCSASSVGMRPSSASKRVASVQSMSNMKTSPDAASIDSEDCTTYPERSRQDQSDTTESIAFPEVGRASAKNGDVEAGSSLNRRSQLRSPPDENSAWAEML